jgi:hypothetical protein
MTGAGVRELRGSRGIAPARSLCLSLELDFDDERVSGWLADEHGNDWAFSSWLDLLTLIERVLAAGHGERSPSARSGSA